MDETVSVFGIVLDTFLEDCAITMAESKDLPECYDDPTDFQITYRPDQEAWFARAIFNTKDNENIVTISRAYSNEMLAVIYMMYYADRQTE